MVLHARDGIGLNGIRIELDPAVVDTACPLIERSIRTVCPMGMIGIPVRLDFVRFVDTVEQHHKLTGRLLGAGIHLAGDQDLGFKSLSFRVGHLMNFGGRDVQRGAAYLSLSSRDGSVALTEVRELLDLLFERSVLLFSEE